MKQYQEILALKKFIKEQNVLVSKIEPADANSLFTRIQLHINDYKLFVCIEDEYDDIKLNSPTLNILLALRALAVIDDSDDYLDWLKLNQITKSNNQLLDYYKMVVSNINVIKTCFKNDEIDYFISDLDFQVNSGAAKYLRHNPKI